MPGINKKIIEYLAELARIRVRPEKENKLLKDLENILKHFEELQELDIPNIPPVSGGNFTQNVFRDDKIDSGLDENGAVQVFPKKESEFLEIPPVFE